MQDRGDGAYPLIRTYVGWLLLYVGHPKCSFSLASVEPAVVILTMCVCAVLQRGGTAHISKVGEEQ
jgi:hypothetical protein